MPSTSSATDAARPHTVRAYVATAERLTLHLGTVRVPDSLELRSYLAGRRTDGLCNASAARELSAVRCFLEFIGGADAAPRMKGPRVKKGVPRPVSPAEAMALAADVAASNDEAWVSARDWAVLLLLYGAGLRIGEAMGLTGAVLPLGATLSVTGKRDKTRLVPLLPQVRTAIERYADLCPHPMTRDGILFKGARGGPLSPAIIRRSVRVARDRLGLAARTTPHALRHSFATHLPRPRSRPSQSSGIARSCQPVIDADLYVGRCGALARCLSKCASACLIVKSSTATM